MSYIITENEDYILTSQVLDFEITTNFTQCVTVTIIDDTVLEMDEVFYLQSMNSSLAVVTPSAIPIHILNDDSN